MSESRVGDPGVRALLGNLALARGTVDRAAGRRAQGEWLAEALGEPATRVLLVRDGCAAVTPAGDLAFVSPDAAGPGESLFLGVEDDVAYVARRVGDDAPAPVEASWRGLREVGVALDDRDAGLMVTAVALDNWHAAHSHCPRCGAPTEVAMGGWVRRCVADGSEHYPRTDPAVIMLVIDPDDRALLGRQGRWQPGWFSTLAGFVEPGESAEAAVRREIEEEAGLQIDSVAYLGSQPWPFPCSLMLGYHAWTRDTCVVVDGEEIVEARWFSREEMVRACETGEVALPPAVSIARRLIEQWFGQPLKGDWIRP